MVFRLPALDLYISSGWCWEVCWPGRWVSHQHQLSVQTTAHSDHVPGNSKHRNTDWDRELKLQEGKELGRVPAIHNGKVQKFFFNEEAIVTAFDLNNVYKKCKEDKKFVPFENKESKKEK